MDHISSCDIIVMKFIRRPILTRPVAVLCSRRRHSNPHWSVADRCESDLLSIWVNLFQKFVFPTSVKCFVKFVFPKVTFVHYSKRMVVSILRSLKFCASCKQGCVVGIVRNSHDVLQEAMFITHHTPQNHHHHVQSVSGHVQAAGERLGCLRIFWFLQVLRYPTVTVFIIACDCAALFLSLALLLSRSATFPFRHVVWQQ